MTTSNFQKTGVNEGEHLNKGTSIFRGEKKNSRSHNENTPYMTDEEIYKSVLPKNDPNYMKSIREWERSVGFVTPLRWINLIVITLFHVTAVLWSIYHISILHFPKWQTVVFGVIVGHLAGFGVTGGAHRYWSHRSYKATLPLQLILLFCYSICGQNTIYEWVRDHRVHHKHSETDADPHNSNRGFFFSHVGWLMMKKHPRVIEEGRKIDLSDIVDDPLCRFHTRYFLLFKLLFCFVLPMFVPLHFWDESWSIVIMAEPLLRYMLTLNFTWSVNSFAHIWGNKPYDKNIKPAENWSVSAVTMGEGWHNYHHTFPWDYRASEMIHDVNFTTKILNCFEKIGWAYDMKIASPELIKAVSNRKGEISSH